MWQSKDDIQGKVYCFVFWAKVVWASPDDPNFKRWELVVGVGDDLTKAYTYNPALTSIGTHAAEFYRDTSNRLCIREPKKESEDVPF